MCARVLCVSFTCYWFFTCHICVLCSVSFLYCSIIISLLFARIMLIWYKYVERQYSIYEWCVRVSVFIFCENDTKKRTHERTEIERKNNERKQKKNAESSRIRKLVINIIVEYRTRAHRTQIKLSILLPILWFHAPTLPALNLALNRMNDFICQDRKRLNSKNRAQKTQIKLKFTIFVKRLPTLFMKCSLAAA